MVADGPNNSRRKKQSTFGVTASARLSTATWRRAVFGILRPEIWSVKNACAADGPALDRFYIARIRASQGRCALPVVGSKHFQKGDHV